MQKQLYKFKNLNPRFAVDMTECDLNAQKTARPV